MRETPLISVIMPVYNAEKYIGRAIESLLEQSYEKWELLAVDDGSSDHTSEEVQSFTDERIHFFEGKENSGSAYRPRMTAFQHAAGEWVMNLDADDFLSPQYMEKMMQRALDTGADICCGKMVYVEETGEKVTGDVLPRAEFDFEKTMDGAEAFRCTVPKWEIGLNGMLCRHSVWNAALKRYGEKEEYGVHDDEILSRLTLLSADRIAFCDCSYFFRINTGSVTHTLDERIFDFGNSVLELQELAGDEFGTNSREYSSVQIYDYLVFLQSLSMFAGGVDSLDFSEIREFNARFRTWHDRLNKEKIRLEGEGIRRFLIKSYRLLLLSLFMSGAGIKKLAKKTVIGSVLKIRGMTSKNKWYSWYVLRKKWDKKRREDLERAYRDEKHYAVNPEIFAVCMYEGKIAAGGLADRLRGILSTYYYCKRQDIPFRLYFEDPFPLADFLEPNLYDWTIKREEISYDRNKIDFIMLDTTQDNAYQRKKQQRYLEKKLRALKKQTHVYTNACVSYDLNYSHLFHELFRPSERLAKTIERQKRELGDNYISVSCRFMDLFGDFNETFGYKKALSKSQAKLLKESVIEQIRMLHKSHPSEKILVNSDSSSFLEEAKKLEYVCVIPGNITHIDGEDGSYDYKKIEKTFVDFLMIAGAKEIYLLRTGKMFNSGYPYAASKVYGKPFKRIEF